MDFEQEQELLFFLTFLDCSDNNNKECVLQLSEYDTVEILKIKIHQKFGIPPHKQLIGGWEIQPECDNVILKVCVKSNIANLQIRSKPSSVIDKEHEAALDFRNFIAKDYPSLLVQFHVCNLEQAISSACLGPLEERKVLLLYLHNQNEKFSIQLLKTLENTEVLNMIEEKFYLFGWNVQESKYESALIDALEKNQLGNMSALIKSKLPAVLFIVPIRESITIFACLRAKFSMSDFKDYITNSKTALLREVELEGELNQVIENKSSENDFNSETYQKLMADLLGDRDYDSLEYDQHELLKDKIGFALFGPPKSEKGYDDKMKKKINFLFDKILKNNNCIAQYKDQVEISFIYNCVEPLPAEKLKRARKDPTYNPNTDLMPLPLFVLRKCRGSDNPCRIFIDDTGRIYQSFRDYVNHNKLHECVMVLPENGRYRVNDAGKVLLERHLSPSCGVGAKILYSADIASSIAGVASGAFFIAATFTPVAPVAILAAGITGVGAGIYGLGRSVFSLIDKSTHDESLSFADSEARGAYLNIIAGSLGFVGAGSNMLVSQLVARGFNIGQGAGAVVNTIGIVNIGVSGASLVNSGYDVIDQWLNENRTPSLLTIVQLSSSVLFFGHAVYNFRTYQTMVDETQARVLQDYQDSLRSNRHRKTFNKLLKETIRTNQGNEVHGRAEVIKTIRNIQNKDEVFAALTRNNKNMNRNGIKFSASKGTILLNGIPIDMNEFSGMTKKNSNSFLVNLSTKIDITPTETDSMQKIFNNIFSLKNLQVPDIDFIIYTIKILSRCDGNSKVVIIDTVAKIMSSLTMPVLNALDQIFPNNSKYIGIINMVLDFFGRAADEMEEAFISWQRSGCDDMSTNSLFQYVDRTSLDKSKRWIKFFQEAIKLFTYHGRLELTEIALKKLLNYFYTWFAKQIVDYDERVTTENNRRIHSAHSPATKVNCSICGGYYFMRN